MEEKFVRTAFLLGEQGVEALNRKHIAVFGIGGVGGYVVEALVRSGVGEITIVDKDEVAESNINRQIIAATSTVGRKKVAVMEERIHDINPACIVHARDCFYLPETAGEFDFAEFDYVVDAVDTVTAKLELVLRAKEMQVPIISSMGAGNKLDPTRFEIADIYKTSVCPLARVMRRELKKRGVNHLKVLYSKEEPLTPVAVGNNQDGDGIDLSRRVTPGSVAFVPSAAGLIIAAEVVKDILGQEC